jgi:hypothetical protein
MNEARGHVEGTKVMARPTRLEDWMTRYAAALTAAVTRYPTEYGFLPDQVPQVAARMREAFRAGSYNKDGRAIKAVCKQLRIPHTYRAIATWLCAGEDER